MKMFLLKKIYYKMTYNKLTDMDRNNKLIVSNKNGIIRIASTGSAKTASAISPIMLNRSTRRNLKKPRVYGNTVLNNCINKEPDI